MRRLFAIGCVLGLAIAAATPAAADPPSWAPAHGWRVEHGHGHAYWERRAVIFDRHTHRRQRKNAHRDRRHHREAPRAHAGAPSRESIAWSDVDADTRYAVTPEPADASAHGLHCREFNKSAVIGGRSAQIYGTACRQPDGAWKIMP